MMSMAIDGEIELPSTLNLKGRLRHQNGQIEHYHHQPFLESDEEDSSKYYRIKISDTNRTPMISAGEDNQAITSTIPH